MSEAITKALQLARDALTNSCLADHERDWGLYSRAQIAVSDVLRQPAPSPQPTRNLTVTTTESGEAVMVSWQDDDHRILEVVWERKAPSPQPAVPVVDVVHVGNLPTINQDLYPALGEWWVQLWDGTGDDAKVIARVYGSDPQKAKEKAESIARAILALRPQAESKTYADGTTATGVAPLPDVSPAEQDAIQAESLLNDLEAMLGGRSGASIKLRSLIRSLRPAVEPMTPFTPSQRMRLWQNTEKGKSATSLGAFDRICQTVEAAHRIGITAKAEDAHQPTKEAEKP